MILYIKHISIEDPGTILTFFEEKRYDSKIIEVGSGDTLPDSLDGIEAVVVLGGPMNVYEEEKYPFLKQEDAFLKCLLQESIPILGICLGAQLIAKACGAQVRRSPVDEKGWFTVNFADGAVQDSFFSGVPRAFDVFQWHEDTFDVPSTGTLLCQGDSCKNQAFKVGENAYGLQYHIEVTKAMAERWIKKYLNIQDVSQDLKAQNMLDEFDHQMKRYNKTAEQIYQNFENIIKVYKADNTV